METAGSIIISGIVDGEDGRGITWTNIYYKADTAKPAKPTGAPSGSGWSDDGNTLITASNSAKHLYESTCTAYSDGTYSWTVPVDDGLISDMAATSEEFAMGDSATTAPETGWSASVTPSAGKWIWSRTKLTFRSGSPKYVNVQCVGYCGTNGRGITWTNIYYKADTDKPEKPTGAPSGSGWADDGNTLITASNSAKHLYESTCTAYSDGTYSWTVPVDDGLISDMAATSEEFAMGDSATTAPETGWSASVTPSAGKWIWSRTKLTFRSGSPKYVNVQCVGYCGTNGTNGTRFQRKYRSVNVYPYPSGSSAPPADAPDSWADSPTPISTVARYRYVIERWSDDGGNTWGSWSSPVVDAYLASDGTSIRIKGQAKGVIGWGGSLPSSAASGDVYLMNNSDTYDIKAYSSESWNGSNAAMGDGYLVDGYLWMKVADTASSSQARWQNMGKIQGPKGNDSVVYSLEATPGSLNFRSDAVGTFTPSMQTVCRVMRTRGQESAQMLTPVNGVYDGRYYLYHRLLRKNSTSDSPVLGNTATVYSSDVVVSSASDDYVVAVEFLLSMSPEASSVDDGNTVKRSSVGISVDGHIGVQGATGKMFFPMGTYDGSKEYRRTETVIPLLWQGDPNTYNPAVDAFGSFWYIKDGVEVVPAGNPPQTDSPYWAKADSFGLVITQGIFAEFAKLGKAIMSGDYMFSMNGRIGNTEYNGGAKIDGVPAYTRFMGDPDALRGSFSADDRYGPIAGDPEIIAEIYLAKGVTLNVSVTAERISGSGIGYFCIYKNGQLTSQSFNSAYVSTKTMTWTSTEDGWYKIEYYNSISSTHFRFSVSYNITGYFEPNWWVDLMTGKMVAARGNFVVNPNGDIILKNLFRRAAFTWYSITGTETRVVNTGNVTSAWVYMRSKDTSDADLVAIMNKYGIDVGDYLEMTPDMDASDYWYIMDNASWGYDSENCHFIVCTYYADMVVALDIENNESNVFLPAAKDFSGKVVEVYNSTTGTGVLKVRPADLQLMGFSPSLKNDHFTLDFNRMTDITNYYPVSGGGTVTFYSNGSTWIVLRNNRPT